MNILMALVLVGGMSVASVGQAAEPGANKTDASAAAFVTAIRSGNMSALRAYFPKDYPSSELAPNAPAIRFTKNALLPIVREGPIEAKETARKGHLFSILFYQARFKGRLDSKSYLEKDYLKSFFVCNFDDSTGRWILADPIMCYDETEGPYEHVGY